MRIVEDLGDFPRTSYPVMAIGVFDGVHRGHQAILRQMAERACQHEGTAMVLTFSPHPQKVISSGDAPPLLQTPRQKERMLARLGVEVLVRLPFTRRLSLLPPEKFARDILHNHGIREIHVGSNFRFGHRRSGDVAALKRMGEELGFEVFEVPALWFRGRRISSTQIRRLLAEGRVALARRLLGRPYAIHGVVVRGAGRGAHLGYPTANLEVENELIPLRGVYATRALLDGTSYPSVSNVGLRPTLEDASRAALTVETHLLDFRENVYGKTIDLEFCCRLRREKRFPDAAALSRQIARDVQRAGRYLARFPGKEKRGS